MDAKQTRQGVLLALAAYFIWGIAPAYFKLIYYVPADEILTHRVIWSFFFMVVLMSICRQWSYLKTLIQTCLLYTSPSPRDRSLSRMPSSA